MMGLVVLLLVGLALVPITLTCYYCGVQVHQYARAVAVGYGIGKNPDAQEPKKPVGKRSDDHEPAWEHYLLGQAWRDVRHAHLLGVRGLRDTTKARWKKIDEKYVTPVNQSTAWGVVHYFCLVVGLVVAAWILVLAVTGAAASLGLLLGAGLGLLYLLRLFDTMLLRLRGVTMTCKSCGNRVAFAHYSCPGCDTLHGNLRPGRYGMTHRMCKCGKRFPSLMVLKSYELKSWCPGCGNQLADKTGMTAEIVLPVFGAGNAGKSQLITVLIIAVETMATRAGGTFSYADVSTQDRADRARRTLETTKKTEKTKASNKASVVHPAYSMHVGPRRGQAKLLHVFDAAGEVFTTGRQIQELEYFKIARTFIFVIDPLSIKAVWETLEAAQQTRLDDTRAKQEPHVTFTETVSTIAAMGIATDKIHLAVAVSKGDLIKHVLDEVDTGDPLAIESWLDRMAQGNMIRAMNHTFKEVSFFLTSALPEDHNEAHHSIEKFTAKTLATEGLRL